jgi:hypothetical protein
MSVTSRWFWFRHDLRGMWIRRLPLMIARRLPKRVAMWSFYCILSELDAEAGPRGDSAFDVIDKWSRYHGL